MTHYLIEFRFSGNARTYLENLIYDISEKFQVRGVTRKRPVPHISLAGPLYTNNEKRLVKEVFDVVRKYDMVGFSLYGFGKFSKFYFFNRVVYVHVEPSKELEQMRREISERLEKFCKMQDHDYKDDFDFHATIAFKDINWKFGDIWKYIQKLETPIIDQTLLRVTIIKDKKILCEHDLMLRRELNRLQALDKNLMRKTIMILQQKKGIP